MVEGVAVERDALRIAERIREYDPNLTLQYLEEAARLDEPPFRVIEHCKDGVDRVAFTAWQLDERLLARVYHGDSARHDIDRILTERNRKAKDRQNQRFRDSLEEANDITQHVIKSPRVRYTVRLNSKHGVKKVRFE
jgi:hypothetical protein